MDVIFLSMLEFKSIYVSKKGIWHVCDVDYYIELGWYWMLSQACALIVAMW